MATLLIVRSCATMRCPERCCSVKNIKHLGLHKSDFCCSQTFYDLHEIFRKTVQEINPGVFPPLRSPPTTTTPEPFNLTTISHEQDHHTANDHYHNMAIRWSHFGIASAITALMLLVMVLILLGYLVRRKQRKHNQDGHSASMIVHHSAGTDELTINDLPQICDYQNMNHQNIGVPNTQSTIAHQKEIINRKALEANLFQHNNILPPSQPSTSALPAYEDLFLTENEITNQSVA